MNIELKDISDSRKTLTVSLDPSEVENEHQAVLGEFSRHARVPGFRPGKAPAALIQRQFGKQVVEEFRNRVVGRAYRDGLKESKLDVIQVINAEPVAPIEPGKSATLAFTVDLRPQFELPDYTGIATQIESTEPTEEEIEGFITGLRQERAEFKVVERPAQKGDYVKFGYEGKLDGQPMAELVADRPMLAKLAQTWEEVESAEGMIPGLSAALAGAKAGDKKEATVTFPADFPTPALAGKTALYTLDIQEVRERSLPPLDEAFLKTQKAATVDELKERLRQSLRSRKEGENRAAQRRQVTEALASRVNFNVPESLIESETDGLLRQFIEENSRRGVPQQEFEKRKQELYENARQSAALRLKTRFILGKIAEAEKLKIENQDLEGYLWREAMRENTRPEKIAKELGKDREQLQRIQQSLLLDKALDLVVSKATVSNAPAGA